LHGQILADLICRLVAILQRDEGIDSLAGQLIGDANDSSLGDGVCSQLASVLHSSTHHVALTVLDKGSLDLGGGQTVSRDVDNIVNTTADPVVAIVVTTGTISSELYLS
jgi:hypothetical protein